ncbi:formylglycine-generating enzyme family protein [Azospirillum palustre]
MTCCPSSRRSATTSAPAVFAVSRTDSSPVVPLDGGRFVMGTNDKILPQDGEFPARPVTIKPISMDRAAVTVSRFARFVAETGHVTEAERFGWSYVFFALMDAPETYPALPGLEWWRRVEGASWRSPEGPESSVEARADHPVTHVSWNDAVAFASWAGGRLPTEAEWEYAAAGGLSGARFPWGEREPDDTDFQPCNIWQGRFPDHNTSADGFLGTAPAESFAPNGFGLYNMVGNTWEWTADRFRIRSVSKAAQQANAAAKTSGMRVIKGGSYLCHNSYCYRYRIAARTSSTPDSTTGHMGFRLCYDGA